MAGIYLIYSLLVYFGTLGGDGHDWWPIFLYPVIWPFSWLIEFADRAIPATMMGDYIVGFFYIVLGTLWIWLLGCIISILVTRLFLDVET